MQFTKGGGIVLLLLSCVLLIKHGTLPDTFEDHTHCTVSLTNPYHFSSLTTYLVFLPSKRTGYAQVPHSKYRKFPTLRRARLLQGYSDNIPEKSGVAATAEGLLGPDGSISEAYLKAMNADVDRLDLQWPLIGGPSFSSGGLDIEEKVMGFFPCREGMRDAIPFGKQKGRGREGCVIMVPPLYVRQFKWPHSQTKVISHLNPTNSFNLSCLQHYDCISLFSHAHTHSHKKQFFIEISCVYQSSLSDFAPHPKSFCASFCTCSWFLTWMVLPLKLTTNGSLNDAWKQARQQNVPNVPLLRSKQARAWVNVSSGSTIIFLPGGPMYPDGVAAYLDRLVQVPSP